MKDTRQRFDSLAAQFDLLTRDLDECRSREQRWLLLEGMSLLREIEQLILHEQSAAESAGAAPTNPPFAKAARL